MNLLKNIKSGILSLNISLKHYPCALLFSTFTTIIGIILLYNGDIYSSKTVEILQRMALTTALGFPLFLSIQNLFERKTNNKNRWKVISSITALFLLIFYYFLFLKEINMVSITRYIGVNLSLYLLFLIIPFFYKKKKKVELYFVKILSRLLVTIIYSLVLYSGLAVTLFTLNKLLNVPITGDIYISTLFIVVGIFAPIFLLAGIPVDIDTIKKEDYSTILEILLVYIVIPLISVYTIILYLYFIKILISKQWPEGLVAHLVLWYSSLSIIVLFFIKPLKKRFYWLKSFTKYLPFTLIPLLSMMFTAIGIRIRNYGITENRYFVVILGLWNLGVMIYYIFSQKKNNILLPLSLAILSFLSVFGPWSSYSVSIYSQNRRFEEIVQKYNIIENNKIVKSEVKIKEDDQREINGILIYFDNKHKLSDLKYLPDDFRTDDVEKYFGFPYHNSYRYKDLKYFFYNLDRNKQSILVSDYDFFFQLSSYNNEITTAEPNLNVNINNLNKEIKISQDNKIIYQNSLLPILRELHLKHKNIPLKELNPDDFIYIDETNGLKVKILFNTIHGNTEKENPANINFDNINLYLLLRIK